MNQRFVLGVRESLLLLVLLAASSLALAQSPPTAPSLAYGTYTVGVPLQGAVTMLQEKVGANGTWTTIYSVGVQYPGGTSTLSFTKPPGTYSYRTYVMYTSYYGGTYGVYSSEISVVVQAGSAPTQDLMSNQLGYTYEARVGDLTGDSLPDVLVRRTAGGAVGNGTLDSVLLRRLNDGSFAADVPNATQISNAISQLSVSGTRILLDDVNMDGYVDIHLPDLGNVISGANGQLVIAPGVTGQLAAQKVVKTGAGTKYQKFMADSQLWLDEPDYFPNHAQIYYQPIYGYIYTCDYYYTENGYQYLCYLSSGIIGWQAYYDFSPWDPDAINMRYGFNKVLNGDHQPTVTPGSQDAKNIDLAFRNVFGTPWMRGLWQNNCYDYQYDPETGEPCTDTDFTGMLLLAIVWTQNGNCRPLALGEKEMLLNDYIRIKGVDAVRVCHRAYMYWWVPPFMKSDGMAPDGNVYIKGDNCFFPWREDYSYYASPGGAPGCVPDLYKDALASRVGEFSYFEHELVHVFQSRNGNCNKFCMLAKKFKTFVTGKYVYKPLNRAYTAYNMEQQAQMVQDRFRLNPTYSFAGLTTAWSGSGYDNEGVTYSDLCHEIPILQGNWGKDPLQYPNCL